MAGQPAALHVGAGNGLPGAPGGDDPAGTPLDRPRRAAAAAAHPEPGRARRAAFGAGRGRGAAARRRAHRGRPRGAVRRTPLRRRRADRLEPRSRDRRRRAVGLPRRHRHRRPRTGGRHQASVGTEPPPAPGDPGPGLGPDRRAALAALPRAQSAQLVRSLPAAHRTELDQLDGAGHPPHQLEPDLAAGGRREQRHVRGRWRPAPARRLAGQHPCPLPHHRAPPVAPFLGQ